MTASVPTNDQLHVAATKTDLKQSQTTYDDLLPASYRTADDDLHYPALTGSFLKKELGVDRLNRIHYWLWLVGRPMPPRPLYYQKALGRELVIHEQADLHLVWDEQRIFLKPVPRYLLDENVWRDVLSCKGACEEVVLHGNHIPRSLPQVTGMVDPEQYYCERCSLRRLATGFLLTYASLISYEHDFHIAKSSFLIPSEMTWLQWRQIVRRVLDPDKKRDINLRYHYGELRLGRLNKIYRLTLRAPIRGYLYGRNTYHQFWNANLGRIATAFGYIIVVLTAMQVGLATERLNKSEAFQRASYGFTVFSIVAPLIIAGLLLGGFLGALVINLLGTLKYSRKRFTSMNDRHAAPSIP